MKRLLYVPFLFLLLILIGCGRAAYSTTASSTSAKASDSGYDYEVIDEGVRITRSHLNMQAIETPSLILPSQIGEMPVKVIGNGAFYNLDMESCLFPEELMVIEGGAFYRCGFLREVVLPQNVVEVGSTAFSKCLSLENIFVDPRNPAYIDVDGILFTKDMRELVYYPEGRTKDIVYAIPETVTRMENPFFYKTHVKELIIPPTVVEFPSYPTLDGPDNVIIYVTKDSAGEAYFREYWHPNRIEQLLVVN